MALDSAAGMVSRLVRGRARRRLAQAPREVLLILWVPARARGRRQRPARHPRPARLGRRRHAHGGLPLCVLVPGCQAAARGGCTPCMHRLNGCTPAACWLDKVCKFSLYDALEDFPGCHTMHCVLHVGTWAAHALVQFVRTRTCHLYPPVCVPSIRMAPTQCVVCSVPSMY